MSPEVDGRRVPHPIDDARLPLFRDRDKALEHVRKHVLGDFERQAWRLAIPAFAEHPALNRGARSSDAEELLGLYFDAIGQALEEARALRWANKDEPFFAIGDPICVAMGILGLLVVIDHGRVVTAFFPGQGRDDAPVAQLAQGGRQSAWRKPRRQLDEEPPEGPAELIYEKVFSTAFEFVRRTWAYSSSPTGEARHYHILNEVLPRTCPNFLEWQLLTDKLRSESPRD